MSGKPREDSPGKDIKPDSDDEDLNDRLAQDDDKSDSYKERSPSTNRDEEEDNDESYSYDDSKSQFKRKRNPRFDDEDEEPREEKKEDEKEEDEPLNQRPTETEGRNDPFNFTPVKQLADPRDFELKTNTRFGLGARMFKA